MSGAPSEGGTGAPLGDVTPETDATPALDGAAPDSRTFASRKREPCSLLAGAPLEPHFHVLRHQPQVHRSDRADESQHGRQPPAAQAGAADQLIPAPVANDLH